MVPECGRDDEQLPFIFPFGLVTFLELGVSEKRARAGTRHSGEINKAKQLLASAASVPASTRGGRKSGAIQVVGTAGEPNRIQMSHWFRRQEQMSEGARLCFVLPADAGKRRPARRRVTRAPLLPFLPNTSNQNR